MAASGLLSLLDTTAPLALAGTALALLAAAILRSFAGFGFALVAVPLTSMALPPSRSVPVVFLLQLIIGALDTARHYRSFDRSFITMALVACATTPLGVYLLAIASPGMARLTIAVMMLCGVMLLWRPRLLPLHANHGFGAVAGVGVGLCNGMAAMPGPPAIAYSLLTNMPADQARKSLMVLFFITALAGVPSAMAFGIADTATFALAAASMPVIILGSWIGEMLFRRYGTRTFRSVALLTLIGTALAMLARELWMMVFAQ